MDSSKTAGRFLISALHSHNDLNTPLAISHHNVEVHINNITQVPLLGIRGLCSGIINKSIFDLSSKNGVMKIYGLRHGLVECRSMRAC